MIGLLRRPAVPSLIEETLGVFAREHRVPGAQLAVHDGGDTLTFEVGELERGGGRRVTRDAAFPVGSITKSFTATVAMILVADGDVELDEPLGEHLPELGELGDRLTLRQVLSHTAGLAADADAPGPSAATIRRYVTEYCRSGELLLPPGTAFSYSNLGYALAGRLIETLTGMSWCNAVASILLEPLGIEAAFVVTPGPPRARRPIARGHSVNRSAGRTRPVDQLLAPGQAPAGALAVSAADLLALGLMHVGRGATGLLPPAWAEEMRRPVPAADPFGLADGWGLGLAVYRDAGVTWVGHDGNAEGTACFLRIDPDGGRVVAFTSNANTGTAMWREVLAVLARADIALPSSRAWTSPASIATPPRGCAGRYTNGELELVVRAGLDGNLYLSIDGSDFERLTLHDGLAFSLRDPMSAHPQFGGRFVRDPGTGGITGLHVGGRLAVRRDQPLHDSRRQLIA